MDVERLLDLAPGLSVWNPATHEYALVGPWRHRPDIVHAVELVSIRHPVELMRFAIDRAIQAGSRLFLALEMTERRQTSFYGEVGLQIMENVLSYELHSGRSAARTKPDVDIHRIEQLSDLELNVLTNVDHDAFPWLWRNSVAEFREYFAQAGVEMFVLRELGTTVAYLGITSFPSWGHIDRVAVMGSKQGNGLGTLLTNFAIDRLIALGAARIGLSTQQRNVRSQTMYERLGFRRQVSSDYRIYGRVLWQNDSIDDLVMGQQA